MDKKTVYVKTTSGASEVNGKSDKLYGDVKRVLLLVDGKSTVGEISKRAPPSLRETLNNVLQELEDGGYIRDMHAPANEPQKSTLKIATPPLKGATPKAAMPLPNIPYSPAPSAPAPDRKAKGPEKANSNADLDFSFITPGSGLAGSDVKAAQEKAQADAIAKARQEADRLKAEQSAQIEAAARAAKLKAYEEAKEKEEIEAAAKVRAELEATKIRVEAEARARIEAEVKIRQEAEREAEKIRLELAAVRAKTEEEMRKRLEAEARAKAEEEARQNAERLKIETARAELEIARIKAEAELKMREEAEARIRSEVEARLKAQEPARHAELPGLPGEAGRAPVTSATEQMGPAERLRQSFSESFGQASERQKSSRSDFKLDAFSLDVPGQKTDAAASPPPPKIPASGGSEAKAETEQRVRTEAEARRVEAEREAAQLKAEQEQADRVEAEQRSIHLKAEQEAYRLKVAQEEERAQAEAEAKKLTDQQSRQWKDAQQRAAIHEQAEKERAAKQAAEAQLKSQRKTARALRKKLPIGKMVAGLFALVLIAVAGLPYVWPTDEYIAPLEAEISAHINQPVHIKKIRLALLPLPALALSSLEVGGAKELMVEDVVLNFDFSALFAQTKSINSLVLDNMTLSGASLDKALAWLQAAGGIERYPVARMELRRVGLKSNEVKLPLLSGRADFDTQGKFTRAVLKSEDDKYGFELLALQKGLQLELSLHESSLPVFPDIKFNDLSASGMVENGEFACSDFFAHIYGGTVTGKGKLTWSNGWKLEGQLNAKSLELQNLFPNFGVTGQLYGDVSVAMYGPVLAQLDKAPRMEGSFEAKDGVINKLDIDTIARFGSRQGAGGRTSFTELAGTLKASNTGQHVYLNRIAAGAVSGSGLFEVDDSQQLTGKLMVEIKGLSKPSVLLQLSGTPAEPLLQAGR